jgi:glycosyltransferase involved in cell wall biosynthesis
MNDGAWHIVTGEYPPAPGGVADYSAILAEAMAAAGVEVHVWTGVMDPNGEVAAPSGVTVHRIANAWSESGLRELGATIDTYTSPHRLLIQYVPNAWGQRGMNQGFCAWVAGRANAGDEIRLMIHEPFLPYQLSLGPARWYMAWVQRRMMRTLLSAAQRVYLSIPGWLGLIKPFEPQHDLPVDLLPIFSNIPVAHDPERVRDLRAEAANPRQLIVGSFGTFGGEIGRVTGKVFALLLADNPDTVGVLLGRGAAKLAAQVRANSNVPQSRLFAFEDLSAEEVSLRLQGCDVLVQPYPDGISSRRGSALAGMAHGLPIVTNHGFLTDPIWLDPNTVGGVPAIKDFDARALAKLAAGFLLAEDSREGFGRSAREFYQNYFAVEHTVATLLNDDQEKV